VAAQWGGREVIGKEKRGRKEQKRYTDQRTKKTTRKDQAHTLKGGKKWLCGGGSKV